MNEFTELHNRQKSYVWRIRVDYGMHDELYHTNGFSVEGNIIVASSYTFREWGLEEQSILGRRLCEDGFRRKLRVVYLSDPSGVALLEEEDGCSSDAFGIFEKDINLQKRAKVYTTTSYENPVSCFLKAIVLNDVESAGFIPPRDTDTICARYKNISRDVNPIMGNIFNLSTLRSVTHYKKYLGDLLSTIPIIACGGFPPFETGSGGPVTTLEGSIVGMLSIGHNENPEGVAIHATFIERCIEYYRAVKIKNELVIKEDKKGKHKKNRENRKRSKKSNEDKKGGSRKSQKQHTYGGKTRSTVLEWIEGTEMIKYSNKEIFLRELVSKASDALDKIRFESSTDKSKPGGQPELCIHIIPDKAKNTLTITNSGFGMTKADLVNNLGTIEFMEALAGGADVSIICQFGIGFFSAYGWESQAGRSFTITKDTTGEVLGRGTKITLYLKEDQLECLKECRDKELVKKHSEFISYPISLWGEKTIEKEISDDEDRGDKKDVEGKVEEVDKGKETEEKNKKKIKEISHDEALINKQKPIWMRKPEEITKQESTAFYKKPTIVWEEEHLAVKHFSIEGKLKFKAVLFVPKGSPFDLFDNKILMKECIEMIFEIAENKEDYNKFCEAFSENLKLGIHEDSQNKTELADFLCYHSPFLVKLKKIGYEVPYMVDAIDGYAVGQLKEFDGKKLVSAAKEGLKLKETDEKKKKEELKEQFECLCKVTNDVLGEKDEKVVVSGRVVGSPFSLVIGEYGWTANMERMMKTKEISPENEIMDESAFGHLGLALMIPTLLKPGLTIEDGGGSPNSYIAPARL